MRGREWTNPQGEVKVFNTIEAWKVFKSEIKTVGDAANMIDEVIPPADDDLPF